MTKIELIEKWEKELEACTTIARDSGYYSKEQKKRALSRALTIIAMLVDVKTL